MHLTGFHNVETTVRTVNVCRILCLLSCADFGQLESWRCGVKIAVTVKLLMDSKLDAMDLADMCLQPDDVICHSAADSKINLFSQRFLIQILRNLNVSEPTETI